MLRIDHLTKYYGKTLGVKDLSLELKEGEIFGFVGPNGAGKSTTIKCIMNLINKSSGHIFVNDMEIEDHNYLLKEQIGYLPSEIHLYDEMKVIEIIKYANSFYNKDCLCKASKLIELFSLDKNKKIGLLSLGNLKKLGIILSLMHEPQILILDEPTSGLDPLMQEKFYDLLKEEKQKGTTIFFSSHNLNEIKKICDRVGIVKNGQLIEISTINELTTSDMYKITIKANNIAKIKKELKSKIVTDCKDTITFLYNQNINDLIALVSKYQIDKMVIEESSIEDIFIHYYK